MECTGQESDFELIPTVKCILGSL